MVRRSILRPISVAFAVVVLQAVALVSASPVARASAHTVVGCPLSDVALATLAAGGGPVPACAWPEIARAADTSVVHRDCTIVGTEADDVLQGTGERDVICGYQGDDVIKALAGRDIVYGGTGKDRIRGGPGRDSLYGEAGNDRLHGGTDEDSLYGQPGNDRLFGEGWRDYLSGAYGNDLLVGGRGGDYAYDSFGFDVGVLGAGHDQWYSDRGEDTVFAGPSDDWCITAFDERPGDVIDGGPGMEDTFDADAGDTVTGFEIGPEPCYGC